MFKPITQKNENRVKELRTKRGLSQKELASRVEKLSSAQYGTKIHLSVNTLDAIEKFRYRPSLELSTLIAEVFGSVLHETFTYINPKK